MSGGSYDYMYCSIRQNYVGRMYDPELDAMMDDLCDLLKDLEWWKSGDIGEESYRKEVRKFKFKWLGGDKARNKRLKELIEEEVSKTRDQLLEMIGETTVSEQACRSK